MDVEDIELEHFEEATEQDEKQHLYPHLCFESRAAAEALLS